MIKTHFKSYNQYLPFALVLIYEKDGQFNEMIRQAINKYPDLRSMQCDDVRPNVMSFVCCPEDTNTIYMFATDSLRLDILVHECTHIVMRIFECIGADVNESTEEFFAYLSEMIFRDVLDAMKKKFEFVPELCRNA